MKEIQENCLVTCENPKGNGKGPIVGILRKDQPVGKLDQYYFYYRKVKNGLPTGQLLKQFVGFNLGDSLDRIITDWGVTIVEEQNVIDAWEKCNERASSRGDKVEESKVPYKNILEEITARIGELPEAPMGEEKNGVNKIVWSVPRLTMARKAILIKLNIGNTMEMNTIGLDSLVTLQDIASTAAVNNGTQLHFTGLKVISGALSIEFLFD